MPSHLFAPTLAVTTLSLCLSLAVIGTAGNSLNIFHNEHTTNPWLLPVWPNHFDTRELEMLIGTAAGIAVCNALLLAGLSFKKLPANGIVIIAALLSTIVSITGMTFTAVVDSRAPMKDTLKTWTCRWMYTRPSLDSFGPPQQFQSLCHKTRFAYWSTVPLLILQVVILGLGLWTLFAKSPKRSGHEELEKGSDAHGHPLRDVSNARGVSSFETKSESLRSYPMEARGHSSGKQ